MLALLLALSAIASANVIGIDIGTEYFKVSIIKPGVKLAIVENSHTKRKTPTAIAFYQDERLFGIDAENIATKAPETTLTHIPRLTGVAFNDTSVTERLENEYFQYKIVENEQRTSISYQVKDQVFTNEEILAQLFEHIKSMVDIQAGSGANLKDTVITVPAFWNRAQRASIMGAASAAKLKVLNLIHENTAATLYYGAERMDNETDHYAVFYNLGASYLQVSLAKFSSGTKVITKSEKKTVENIEILAHAWDSTLGGRNLDAALVQYMLSQNSKIQRTPRAYAKLIKQARKTKETLSANRETSFVIESLLEGGDDFKLKLTREDFEAAWEHLVPQLTAPIQSVLDQAGLTKEDIHSYEIIGGSVRVPKVQ